MSELKIGLQEIEGEGPIPLFNLKLVTRIL